MARQSSPPATANMHTPKKPSTSSRASTNMGSVRSGTPRTANTSTTTTSAGGSAATRTTKDRGTSVSKGSEKEAESRHARRRSVMPGPGRDKPPSKDGISQRAAKEVAGLKDFQLGDCLGRGAFGSVYRALNWSTGETVAIKQVRMADLQKAELNVIMQEIDLLKNLHHPNIVKYQGFVKSTENLYIILEYCENGSLHSICKNFGKFPENLVSLYTAQVLQGLLFLHDQGVIHRDIKGANILTTKEGLVKLADFGVATKAQGLTEGSVVGTPYWMAPEVIELSGATTASDIWSLGCTVIELLDGRPPYHKLAPMPALFRIVNDDHPPLPEGVSPLVRDFLMQCFQKDPNLRVTAKKLLKHPWIVSTKKAESKKPTDYHEAVRSVQDWNEQLKSPDAGTITHRKLPGRNKSRSPAPPSKSQYETPVSKGPLGQRKTPATEHYQSPDDDDKKDNWDDDFDTTISPTALKLPAHRLQQGTTAGQFTADRLKQFASFDGTPEDSPDSGKIEQWDDEFEGSLTVRSPIGYERNDAVETVRQIYPPGTKGNEARQPQPLSYPKRPVSKGSGERRASKESQPKTQILRSQKSTVTTQKAKLQPKVVTKSTHSAQAKAFVDEDEDDYSDLVPEDEVAFQRKLSSFSPKGGKAGFHPDDLRMMQNQVEGGVRRASPRLVHDAAAMKRTRSSLEIQKYAEHEEDDDFTDIHFRDGGSMVPINMHTIKTDNSSASGSERGTMKLSSSSVLGDEDEEDDPFAALEEELDEVDLQSNAQREKHARLCNAVEGLVSDIKSTQPEEELAETVDHLLEILFESPDVKSVVVSSHGMLPMLEILDTCNRPPIILRLLKIVNIIISNNVEVQENLCFVGGIPIISKFAHKKYASDIRLEAAAFVRMMYQTSTLTLQMFVSCGGLNVLVEFLEEDYDTDAGRELVLVGVNGVWSVFELQGPTPKNDFCRIFSRSSVLYPLSLVLNRVLDEEGELAELIEGRIVNIFLLFSQAENHVKETVADRMVLKRVLKDLRRMSPAHQITMLKFIKNLSMLQSTLDALQNSNAIEVLTDLLNASLKLPTFREISNQILNTMYNLCRLSKARQEDAALSGVIPLLQRIVRTERPLKEFALPILCDMAHSGKVGRKVLWQNKGLQFYISLLADQYWQVTALDAIFIWLQEETAKVEEHLLASSEFTSAIVQCFNESKGDAFENLLEPLQKLLRLSPQVAANLAHPDLFQRTVVRLHTKKALVRLNLLRVIRSICDARVEDRGGELLCTYGLLTAVADLAKNDPAILVREMANELVKSAEYPMRRPLDGRPLRRTSSSTLTPPAMLGIPPSPAIERSSSRGYFDMGMDFGRARPSATSPYHRPISRESSGSSTNLSSNWTGTTLTRPPSALSETRDPSVSGLPKPRTIRQSTGPGLSRTGSRLSMMPTTGTRLTTDRESLTPTHAPPSAGTRAVANARRRRQTSGGEAFQYN
ncbi:hypothetical protein K431DRAFT_313069 [Polychaeton citri CBS 116435]|uniref:mitogen-activated protein kinase n=1 Tax=Polychaeton citri CBS 116435 TaxID=1314669 RepID=A0A9P4UM26_9PEZI|nr:hypothetical protein K431DRAFT_313069 [Polychaeton citri CBS 116435]